MAAHEGRHRRESQLFALLLLLLPPQGFQSRQGGRRYAQLRLNDHVEWARAVTKGTRRRDFGGLQLFLRAKYFRECQEERGGNGLFHGERGFVEGFGVEEEDDGWTVPCHYLLFIY
ncbi:hypothetical protein GYH30_017869 [Glycine max]|nr:hypothetical protein GYH30_017869 [Glycine max]